MTRIGKDAFYSPNLERIDVSPNNSAYKSANGVLYSKDGKILIKYPENKKGAIFDIPDGVERVVDNAFLNCKIEKLYIPASVKFIGASAFSYYHDIRLVADWNVDFSGFEKGWNRNHPVIDVGGNKHLLRGNWFKRTFG